MASAAAGRKLAHIELLRGVSVLLVVFYHLRIPGSSYGFLGVDVFFVISGFLMAHLYGDVSSWAGVEDFFRRRLSRLLPAYYVVLILTTFAAALLTLPHEFSDTRRYALWSAFLAPNVGFWLDNSYFHTAFFRPFLNFWSLGVELQFYLVFPLIAVLARRYPRLTLLLSVASFIAYFLVHEVSNKTAFFQMPFRLWQFMAGFYLTKWSRRLVSGEAALALLIAVVLAGPLLPTVPRLTVPLLTATVTVLAALFISGGLRESVVRSAPGKLLVVLGKYSYSIYLVHYPIIALLAYRPFGGNSLELSPAGHVAAIVLTALLSVLLYHLVESPLRQRRSLKVIAGTLALGAIGTATVATASAPFNRSMLTAREQVVADAWLDRLPYRCPKLQRLLRPLAESCAVGRTGGRGFLLVGDSHADALKQVLAEEIDRSGGELRVMVQNYAVGGGYSPEAVIAEARARRIGVVVLHARPDHIHVGAIQELVRQAAALGIRVMVIAPAPQPGYHVPRRIMTLLRANRPIRPTEDIVQYRRENAAILQPLDQLARNAPNFRLFNLDTLLCNPLCALQELDGRPLYFDENHLSQTGVQRLRPLFREIALAGR